MERKLSARRNLGEMLIGFGFLALGAFAFLYSGSFPNLPGGMPGPGLFPRVASGMMALFGAYLAISLLVVRRKTRLDTADPGSVQPSRSRAVIYRGLSPFVVILGYMLLVGRIGFLLTVAFLNFALSKVLGVKTTTSLVVSVVVSLAIYLLFGKLLAVPLPTNIMGW